MNVTQRTTIDAFSNAAYNYHHTIAKLNNYNQCFDTLLEYLSDDDIILDLACGTANISSYLCKQKRLFVTGFDLSKQMLDIASDELPEATFKQQSIVEFSSIEEFDAVINGFGIPYLSKDEIVQSIDSSIKVLHRRGVLFFSFMEGDDIRIEQPSFDHDAEILVHYYPISFIEKILTDRGFSIVHQWKLDYNEEDGSVTKDIVLIAQRK